MNKLKIAGLALTVIGAVVNVAAAAVNEKQTDNNITDKINKAIADLNK